MSKKLLLEIVTPDRKVLSQDVDYVGAPGALGEFGVLPNHIPFLSALGIGGVQFCHAHVGSLPPAPRTGHRQVISTARG